MRLLILGGTSEARDLAERLAGDERFSVTLSLAGRTTAPLVLPVPVRVGGFGGIDGLRNWLAANNVDAVIDATHPFADQISKHAVAATRDVGIPLGSVVRAAWDEQRGDLWTTVEDSREAARVLGAQPARVFLSVGRLELSAFCKRREHTYFARTIDPPGDISLPPDITFIFNRGPFALADELALLQNHRIDVLVSKHSGGAATYAKIAAARALEIPVVMIARPLTPIGTALQSVNDALSWLGGLTMDSHTGPP